MKTLRNISLFAALILALGLLLGVSPAYAAGISVDPSYGNYDNSFDVSADGFNKNETVSLWVGLSNGSTVDLGQTTADADGNIGFTVSPSSDWPTGEVIVVAHGMSSQQEYSTKFTLTEGDSSSSSVDTSNVSDGIIAPVVDGLTITYVGTGYTAGERVSAWFQYPSERGADVSAHALPDVYADSNGVVTFPFTVGSDWEAGQYHITAEGAQSKHVTFNAFSFFGTITNQETHWNTGTSVTDGSWYGEYYDNPDLDGDPVLTRTDAAINFNWGTSAPDSAVPADDFSVRWTTTRSLSAGNYTITATADDGIRVWVDGTLVIDEWFNQPATTYSTTVYLGEGNHSFQVEYYDHELDAVAIVSITAQ